MKKIIIFLLLSFFVVKSYSQKPMFWALNYKGAVFTLDTYGSVGGTNDALACSILTTITGVAYSYGATLSIGTILYTVKTGNVLSAPLVQDNTGRTVVKSVSGVRYSISTDAFGAIVTLVAC